MQNIKNNKNFQNNKNNKIKLWNNKSYHKK